MALLVMYSTGWADYPGSTATFAGPEEVRVSGIGTWMPHPADFGVEARRHSPGAIGIANYGAFLSAIERYRSQSRGQKLAGVYYFGHGRANGIEFSSGNVTDQNNCGNHNLSDCFDSGGIEFFTCNAGQTQSLLNGLFRAWGVNVCGHPRNILWRWDPDPRIPATPAGTAVLYRGINRSAMGLAGTTTLPGLQCVLGNIAPG